MLKAVSQSTPSAAEIALTEQSPTDLDTGFGLNGFQWLTAFFLHTRNISFKLKQVAVALETAVNCQRNISWHPRIN